MKKIIISRERAMQQAPSSVKAEMINDYNRPNINTFDDVMNFKHYFKNWTILQGEHGPEVGIDNSKIYISVYHFLEYQGKDPHKYDTFNIGGYFYKICGNDYKVCKYKEFEELIHKYDFNLLLKNFHEFEKFKK